MAGAMEDLRVLRVAEDIADGIWRDMAGWNNFARDVVGKQLARAADSIGANIAESYGRYNYGEKLQFLYYARGSLFEAKYWVNRAAARQLLSPPAAEAYAKRLSELARQLNQFAAAIKRQRSDEKKSPRKLGEPSSPYLITSEQSDDRPLFTPAELDFITASELT